MRAANLEKTSQACHIYHPGLCIIISFTECRSVICVFGNRLGPAPGSRRSSEAAQRAPRPAPLHPPPRLETRALRAGSPGRFPRGPRELGVPLPSATTRTCAHSKRARPNSRPRALTRVHTCARRRPGPSPSRARPDVRTRPSLRAGRVRVRGSAQDPPTAPRTREARCRRRPPAPPSPSRLPPPTPGPSPPPALPAAGAAA